MEQIVYIFVNGTEIIKFKLKCSEIVAVALCIGNVSKDASADNMILDFMDMFMVLVLIMMLFQSMIY